MRLRRPDQVMWVGRSLLGREAVLPAKRTLPAAGYPKKKKANPALAGLIYLICDEEIVNFISPGLANMIYQDSYPLPYSNAKRKKRENRT